MKIHFVISSSPAAKELFKKYSAIENYPPKECDLFVILGGDGFMLKTMRKYRTLNKPFYGINCGTVGFLMNEQKKTQQELEAAIDDTKNFLITPLTFQIKTAEGKYYDEYALNELVLMRKTALATKIRILIAGKERTLCYGDGVLLSTATGSTAYNSSAGGPILPINTKLLALTPLASFQPKNWKGAILKDDQPVSFEVLDYEKRPANLTFDNFMVENVQSVNTYICDKNPINILFDKHYPLDERILKEQFI